MRYVDNEVTFDTSNKIMRVHAPLSDRDLYDKAVKVWRSVPGFSTCEFPFRLTESISFSNTWGRAESGRV